MKYYENEMLLEEGRLCLDFANTLDWHSSQNPIETLVDYPSLVKWATDKQILSMSEAVELLSATDQNPGLASAVLQDAVIFREALYRILISAIDHQEPQESDLKIIDDWSDKMLPRRSLVSANTNLKWSWDPIQGRIDHLLAPVVVSALDLITAPELHRVGQCADDRGCGWLFLDLSRNRSRQWCSMEGCGNRAKAKRHYQKSRQVA